MWTTILITLAGSGVLVLANEAAAQQDCDPEYQSCLPATSGARGHGAWGQQLCIELAEACGLVTLRSEDLHSMQIELAIRICRDAVIECRSNPPDYRALPESQSAFNAPANLEVLRVEWARRLEFQRDAVQQAVVSPLDVFGPGARLASKVARRAATRQGVLRTLTTLNLLVAPAKVTPEFAKHFPATAGQVVQHLRRAEQIRRTPSFRIERITRVIK